MTVAAAVKTTRLVPAMKVAFAAVAVQLPPALIMEAWARSVPFVPRVTEPAVMPKLEPEVSRTVLPVGEATEFRIVRSPVIVNPFVDIV